MDRGPLGPACGFRRDSADVFFLHRNSRAVDVAGLPGRGPLLTGLGLGGMVPIDQSLVAEYAPARIRGRVSAVLPLCWPIGIFAAAGAGLAIVPTFGWRWLFALGALPAVLVFLIRRGIPKSPRWLADQGRHGEARQSLVYIGVDDSMIEQARSELATGPAREEERPATFRDLFTGDYVRRVTHTWLFWFCSGFAASAFSVWLPSIYATYYRINLTRTLVFTFIVAGTSVVGRVFAFGLIDHFGRKALICIGYGVAGCAALWLMQASSEMALLTTARLYACLADIGSLAMTVHTPEVYPAGSEPTAPRSRWDGGGSAPCSPRSWQAF